ncbi:hypothetical protein C8Q70DRAFT_1108303 [Cubamyces menziesii]|nr:hypothetical protein C8Q70DRAFT_1108303 [Cubamyces menziesii]
MSIQASSDSAIVSRSVIQLAGLSEQQKNDVLESVLLAQAVANAHQSTQETEYDALAWYRGFIATIGNTAWVVQASEFTEICTTRTEGTVDKIILESLASDRAIDPEVYSSISKALLAFAAAGKGSPAAAVFDKASISSTAKFASFQIAAASTDGNDVILTIWAYFYSSDVEIGDSALWFRSQGASLSMKTSKLVLRLNTQIYAQVRALVHDKLNDANKLEAIVRL